MPVNRPSVVTLTWTLADAQNAPIDSLTEPTEFLVGGDDLLPKVEEALLDKNEGDEVHVHLEPEHAFGEYDAGLVCFEDRALFPPDIAEGHLFEGLPPGAKTAGMPPDAIYRVTEIYPSHVVLDGNHPLAGLALHLTIRVVDVREASEEEIGAGTVGNADRVGLFRIDSSGPDADDPIH